MKNALNHFELPVVDMDRAVACYEALLGAPLRRELLGGKPYAMLPSEDPGASGALIEDPRRSPGGGALVYLNANGQLDAMLARAEALGLAIVLPRTVIGSEGAIAIVVDTEGNTVGLHSEQ